MRVIYSGLFLDEASGDMLPSLFQERIRDMHVTMEFGKVTPFPEEIMGKRYRLKVKGYGNNARVEGILVELPEGLKPYYRNSGVPHITISKRPEAAAKETGRIAFGPVAEFELECVPGYYTEKGLCLNNGIFGR
jgi:hypothetical protein